MVITYPMTFNHFSGNQFTPLVSQSIHTTFQLTNPQYCFRAISNTTFLAENNSDQSLGKAQDTPETTSSYEVLNPAVVSGSDIVTLQLFVPYCAVSWPFL